MLGIGILLLVGGIAAIFYGGKMRFDRTNETGTEVYESYGGAVANRAASGFLSLVGKIAAAAGVLMVFAGLI